VDRRGRFGTNMRVYLQSSEYPCLRFLACSAVERVILHYSRVHRVRHCRVYPGRARDSALRVWLAQRSDDVGLPHLISRDVVRRQPSTGEAVRVDADQVTKVQDLAVRLRSVSDKHSLA